MKKFVKVVELAAVSILIILSCIVLLQVILRNFFNTGFVWGEEMSRFLLLSMVLIAAPVVFFRDEHVKFDLLQRSIPRGAQKIHKIICLLLVIFFLRGLHRQPHKINGEQRQCGLPVVKYSQQHLFRLSPPGGGTGHHFWNRANF